MRRTGIRRGTGGLNRSSSLGRAPAALKLAIEAAASEEERKVKAMRPASPRREHREWRDARAKVDREGACRACGAAGRLEAAHTIRREHDALIDPQQPRLGRYVHPDDVVPLCKRCHDRYDGRAPERLDLLPHLTLAEQARAVSHVGLVAAARRLTCSRELADGLGANA